MRSICSWLLRHCQFSGGVQLVGTSVFLLLIYCDEIVSVIELQLCARNKKELLYQAYIIIL